MDSTTDSLSIYSEKRANDVINIYLLLVPHYKRIMHMKREANIHTTHSSFFNSIPSFKSLIVQYIYGIIFNECLGHDRIIAFWVKSIYC